MDRLKLIIAEDDESSSYYLYEILNDISSEILMAGSGEEVVELLRNNPDTDLVLMDIRLADLDGYEATRRIRKFNSQVVILAQTAYAMAGDRQKALDTGCNDYIANPVLKNDLLRLIRKHLKKGVLE